MHDPADPRREVDLFAAPPIPFDELWEDIEIVDVAGVPVRVASVQHLVAMKRETGRAQDLADIVALERLLDEELDDGVE